MYYAKKNIFRYHHICAYIEGQELPKITIGRPEWLSIPQTFLGLSKVVSGEVSKEPRKSPWRNMVQKFQAFR